LHLLRPRGRFRKLQVMRLRILLPFALTATLAAPAAAQASFAHVVASGESLSSIAAADGMSISRLAAANGLTPDAQLIAGSTVQIPPQGAGTEIGAPGSPRSSSGSYVVQLGDTLSAIAARAGLST